MSNGTLSRSDAESLNPCCAERPVVAEDREYGSSKPIPNDMACASCPRSWWAISSSRASVGCRKGLWFEGAASIGESAATL